MRVDLPSAARNPISLIGAAIATAMAVLFLVLLALELAGQLSNPYLGLLLFVAVPGVFVLGLLLIPLGIWRERRRRAGGREPADWPVIDLRRPRTRTIVLGVIALTAVNLVIVSLAAYGTVHHMESAAFCGTTCHTTMEPEYAAYQVSAHAKVACVACHVGPGAEAAVEAKLAGTRQLWHLVTGQVPTPVPAPVRSMRPARDTCGNCHWPEKRHGESLRQIREYADDETSSETVTTLQLHVGGGPTGTGSGIHWHIDNRVEFIATDRGRQTIPWVKVTDRSGRVTEYTVPGTTPTELSAGEHRVMDCMDCHNRPAHTLDATPERAVDGAIARGEIPRDLPFARREAVAALQATYESREAAMTGIDRALRGAFAGASASSPALATTIAGVQHVYARNVFPAMNVGWGTYPNNLGHMAFPGCFRCHDDNHLAADGRTIKQDCETCHAMP